MMLRIRTGSQFITYFFSVSNNFASPSFPILNSFVLKISKVASISTLKLIDRTSDHIMKTRFSF